MIGKLSYEELGYVSNRLKERIKELNCLTE
jgi:hypothetical protein